MQYQFPQLSWTKIFRLFVGRNIWILLTIFQLLILLFFLITWSPVVLKFRVPEAEISYWSSLIDNFNKTHRQIKINLITEKNTQGNFTEDLQKFYDITFRAGDSDDLIYMDIIWVSKFAQKGWLLNLSDQIFDQELAEFFQANIKTKNDKQEQLYRIPFRSDLGLLYYRQDLLKKAGYKPPETFQELIEISQALQKQKLATWGYLWQGRQYEGLAAMFVEILQGYGGFWIQPDTLKVGLNQPEAIAAVKFLIRTLDEGISPKTGKNSVLLYSEEESFDAFAKGDTIFLRGWSDIWNKANQTPSIQGKVGVVPMMLHLPAKSGGGCNGSWGLGIAKKSKHPQEAWKAIQYLTSAKIQHQFILDTGFIPSRKALFNDPLILKKYPYFTKLAQSVESSVFRPLIPQYAEASEILQRHLTIALTKQLTPEQAMKEATIETIQLLAIN